MQERVIVRLLDGGPVWYPPGGDGARSLRDSAEFDRFAAIASARQAPLVFAAPGEDIALRDVEFTAGEKRHIAKSLPYLLEDEFVAPVETLHFASRPLSRLSMGVAVCSHECMAHWTEALAALPPLPLWIPEPLLLPWQEGELCVLLEADRILVRSGRNSGFGIERELAHTALDALMQGGGFETVVVYGMDPQADQSLLPDALRDRMQWRTGDFAAALMLLGENRQPLNLHQGQYASRLPLRRWWNQWRWAAGLLGAAFCLQLASTWADYSQLERENLALRQQVEAAYRKVVPRGAVADPERQLRRRLEDLRGKTQSAGFVSMMERIGRAMQAEKGAQLTGVSFNDKVGDVRLNIVVPDFKAVESIRARMASAGLSAEMENSNIRGDVVRARLKIRENRG